MKKTNNAKHQLFLSVQNRPELGNVKNVNY